MNKIHSLSNVIKLTLTVLCISNANAEIPQKSGINSNPEKKRVTIKLKPQPNSPSPEEPKIYQKRDSTEALEELMMDQSRQFWSLIAEDRRQRQEEKAQRQKAQQPFYYFNPEIKPEPQRSPDVVEPTNTLIDLEKMRNDYVNEANNRRKKLQEASKRLLNERNKFVQEAKRKVEETDKRRKSLDAQLKNIDTEMKTKMDEFDSERKRIEAEELLAQEMYDSDLYNNDDLDMKS